MVSVARALSWWVRDYAYAVYWQAHATLHPGSLDDLARGEGRPVILLPGVWETWAFLRPLIDPLRAAGHPVHVVPALRRNSGPVPEAAAAVADLLAERHLGDVVLVAHSKGGLIGKYLMANLDPDEHVRAMVAICTPFAGSAYARFLPTPALRAFSPEDSLTLKLQELVEVNTRITAITGVFDPHIPRSAHLDGARNLTVDDGGHFRLLRNAEVIRTVLEVTAGEAPADS